VELTEHGLDPIALAGRARAERGHLRMFLNDTEGATADLDAALGLADSAGSAALRARVLMLQAQLEMRTPIAFGRSEQRERLDDAIRTFHRLGHFSGQANSLLVKSSWFIDADQPKEAVAAAEKALEIVQLADDRSMLAFALVRSSESLFVAGDRRLAHERALEAALVAVDVGNWLVVGLALLAAAVSAVERSSFDAEESIEAFVTIRRHLGVPLTERELRWASELGFDLASNPDVGKLAEGSTSVPVPAEIGEVVRGLCEGASVS